MKKILLSAAFATASALAFIPSVASAQVGVNISIGQAPPPPRYEVRPPPRRGYIWVPGYWDWNGRRHVWHNGGWERDRPGHHFRPPEWEQRPDGWHQHRGGWDR